MENRHSRTGNRAKKKWALTAVNGREARALLRVALCGLAWKKLPERRPGCEGFAVALFGGGGGCVLQLGDLAVFETGVAVGHHVADFRAQGHEGPDQLGHDGEGEAQIVRIGFGIWVGHRNALGALGIELDGVVGVLVEFAAGAGRLVERDVAVTAGLEGFTMRTFMTLHGALLRGAQSRLSGSRFLVAGLSVSVPHPAEARGAG